MRISAFSAGEFGSLRGVKGTLAPRLSVIWGENESGKTTLLNFLRRLLFAGRWPETYHQGKGTLLVHMNDGRELKIELGGHENLLGEPSGSMTVMPEDFLPFGADVSLAESGLSEASPGLGAFSELTRFIVNTKKLDGLERDLYRPDDPESPLNRLWAEIKNNELEIEGLRDWNASHVQLCEKLEEKREALKNVRAALEKNRRGLARAELTARARPVWFELRELENRLASLGAVRDMPVRGLERLDSLLEKITGLRKKLDGRRQKNAYEASRRRQMENNPIMTLLRYREQLEGLEREMERARPDDETAALYAEAANAGELLKKELFDLAPHWTEEDLASAELSIAAEQKARSLRNTIEALRERSGKLMEEKSREENTGAALQAEIAAKRNYMKTPGNPAASSDSEPGPDDYQAKRGLLMDAKREMLRYNTLRLEIRAEKMCAELVEREMKDEGAPPARPGSYMAKLLLAFLLSVSGIFVAVGAAAPAFRFYGGCAALFCVTATLGPLLSISMSRREHSARLGQWRARRDRRNGELDIIDERISEQREEMQAISASLEQKSQVLGVNAPPTLSSLDETARLLENNRYDVASLEPKRKAREQLFENLEKCEFRLNVLKEKLSEIARESEAALGSWKDWLLQNRFPASLSPESFGSFLTAARSARASMKALGVMRSKADGRRAHEASIDARIGELNANTGLRLDRSGLPAVFASLKEALTLQARIDASLEDKRAADFECSGLEKELAAAVSEVTALCGEMGASGEEELRAMFEEQLARGALEKRLAEARRTLAGILGTPGVSDVGEPEFLADGITLAERAESLKLAASDGEKLLNALSGEVSALEEELGVMASDERFFTLRQKNEILKAAAQRQFRRWLAVVLLKHFAGKTIERNAKNLEPEVLIQAMRFLSLMSASDWKIVPGAGEGRDFCIALERETDGLRLEKARWSASLTEQVNLSVRLAAASRLAELSEPVPVMLDEALACFDENRQRGAAEALWQASEKVQVILFTCHRPTADMFQSRFAGEKGFSVIEMPPLNGGKRRGSLPRNKKRPK